MADIIQLVENGVKKYLKTHANAIEGLKESVEAVVGGDSGDQTLALIGGATTVANFPVIYRKRLGVVRLVGRARLPVTPYGTQIVIGNIPLEFVPSQEMPITLVPVDSSTDKKAILLFQTDGKITLHFNNLAANYSLNNISWDTFQGK